MGASRRAPRPRAGSLALALWLAVLAAAAFAAPPAEVVNSLGMRLVLIPAGSFVMGSDPSEGGLAGERPAHQVTIAQAFYIGSCEVTQGEYAQVMGGNPSMTGPGQADASRNPVDNVDFPQAETFCQELSRREGRTYRLPAEAEWEYACRAGTTGPYAGDDLAQLGWYDANSGLALHPVGQLAANPWGLFDMHGNACEWCRERYYLYSTGEQPTLRPAVPDNRIIRGGCFMSQASDCRSASRRWTDLCGRGRSGYGFRVVLETGPAR